MDRIWKKSYLAKSFCGWCGCSWITVSNQTLRLCHNQRQSFSTYRPEVVHQDVEHTQDQNQHDSAPLGLETNNDHDARDEPKQANQYTPKTPLAGKHESDEQENQQDPPGQLDVHLAVLLIELGQAGRHELLADPRVREHHEQTSDDTQVAQEEVQVEDQSVSEGLGHHHSKQTRDGVLAVFPGDDEGGADRHGDHVGDQEDVRYAPWYCRLTSPVRLAALCVPMQKRNRLGCCGNRSLLTSSILAEIQQLVTPLRDYTERIFQKGDNDQETADSWEVSGGREKRRQSTSP